MTALYRDLASHSLAHGVLFQDDAYLTDREDFHPAALVQYRKAFGAEFSPESLEPDSISSGRSIRLMP